MELLNYSTLRVYQNHELVEWLGFESRNKYRIQDDQGRVIGFAAEQQKGFFGFLFRQIFGHWRTFDIHFFDQDRRLFLIGHHPFRWYFERIEVRTGDGQFLGAIQKRFSILSKAFHVEDAFGKVIMEVSSPIWKFWTFHFTKNGSIVASVFKRWSGLLSEALTDRDQFEVEFKNSDLNQDERSLLLASSVFIDLLYFEVKKN